MDAESFSTPRFDREQIEAVRAFMADLSERELKAVFMRFWGPCSIEEIARELKVSWDTSRTAAAKPPKQYTASQLVRRSDSGNSGDKLPMGSTIPARLVNSVLSSDANSPVIAEIADELYWKGGVLIPSGTRAIGQGMLDDATERLQVRFHTLVFPEGDQHSISAIALLTDGSSGIGGDFHTRTFKRQAGRFFGNFVGGLAQGMKDRESGGWGTQLEPGSIKNGLLNGIASSSFDQAKSFMDDTQKLKPFLEVPGGTQFVLYLEKEFSP